MEILTQIIWAIAPSVAVGVIMACWNKQQKEREEEEAERDALRIKSIMFQLDIAVASAQLAYAVAMAYKRGKPNGEMDAAISQYEQTMTKFRKFEREQMARNAVD